MLIKKWGHILFVYYLPIFKTTFRFLRKRDITKHLLCAETNGMCPHFYVFLVLCSLVPEANLCWASTAILQKKDEIRYVLPRDGIPAIKSPEFVPASEAGLDDNEPVIGITINGESRAYSVYLLNHHEIVNDKIGDEAFAVTWCPLANLAVVYGREIDGNEYTFGVSGKLLKNTLVMFDYETDSLWPIVYGEAIDGKLSGMKLNNIPGSQKMPWGEWKALHPETLVLSYQGTKTIGYDAYKNYHGSERTGIHPVKNVDNRLRAKTNIIGIEVNDKYKAYPFSLFNNTKIITDEFHGLNLLVYRNNKTGTIMVYDRKIDGSVIDFEKNMDNATDNVTNTTWDLEGGIGIDGSMKGKTLRPVNFLAVYWFVWADYHPETEVFY
ncbi:MAG: hypothetical protein SCARUB_03525 [Candidatus Scalindua rubra]|uniref:DUF3179 domain-containing protein n=1 Tax=Candidatus Scalindua rubra TaxID=1872076 RepID=A0A1E3X6V0_9BACT|nr:MAG: hypothetical protein SCARUB_03525 [Candidatus Scalindua rubra]